VIESEEMEGHRHAGATANLGGGGLQRIYKTVHDFDDKGWDDVTQYHEEMMRMRREGFSRPSPLAPSNTQQVSIDSV
jgi:hypothetical protein